jgi:hypothetical protein
MGFIGAFTSLVGTLATSDKSGMDIAPGTDRSISFTGEPSGSKSEIGETSELFPVFLSVSVFISALVL